MGSIAITNGTLVDGVGTRRADLLIQNGVIAEVGEGDIKLTAPEIAENGNTVPIEVSSDSAAEIMVLALGNPEPPVATFKFGPLAASRTASTRIRLASTQDVIAIARLEDGSFVKDSATVKVTIGGCGG